MSAIIEGPGEKVVRDKAEGCAAVAARRAALQQRPPTQQQHTRTQTKRHRPGTRPLRRRHTASLTPGHYST